MPIYKAEGKKDGLQKYRVRVNYTDNSGNYKQIERTAYGKEEAKEIEHRMHLNLQEEASQKITVNLLYDEYIASKRGELKETSIDRSTKILKTYVIPKFGTTKLNKITSPTVVRWKTYINEHKTAKGDKLSLAYKQKIYSCFRALLNFAVQMEYISSNPLAKVGNFRDSNTVKKKMDFYTSDEFTKFIKSAKQIAMQVERNTGSASEWNFYMFFMFAFYTGMRKGEIHALKWTDIEDDTIHITRSIAQKLKGGDRETPPKNKSSIRSIQIPIPLKKALKEHFKRSKRLSGFSEEWRICGGKTCIRDSTLEKRNKKYAEDAKIKKIRIHDFRHSHASLLANNGINIQEIARRLGHSNIEETWNTYSHLYPKEEERALSVLNKI